MSAFTPHSIHPLSATEVAVIRRLLLIGLACHSQLEELRGEAELSASLGFPWPDDAMPVDRLNDPLVTTKFALALSLLEPEHG
jgi:hypothetical protein